MNEVLQKKPDDCSLTDEQWERVHPALKQGTGVWIKDTSPETLRKVLALCNLDVLPDIAALALRNAAKMDADGK